MEGLEKIMEDTNGEIAHDHSRRQRRRLLHDGNGTVIGVEYEKGGALHQEYGPVVIATGGFGADYKPVSLLKKYCDQICKLCRPPTAITARATVSRWPWLSVQTRSI